MERLNKAPACWTRSCRNEVWRCFMHRAASARRCSVSQSVWPLRAALPCFVGPHRTAALFADGLTVREVALMVPGLSAPAVKAMPGGGRAHGGRHDQAQA